jgi:hypothetical protein
MRAEFELIEAAMQKLPNYTGNADKMVAVNGSGTALTAVSAAAARANMGLTGLEAIAALATTDGNIIVGDGSTWVAESGATARTSLGVAIGTNVQAWDANLDQIAALSPDNDNIIVGNGAAWVLESGATARASLGLTIGTHVQAFDAATSKTNVSETRTATIDMGEQELLRPILRDWSEKQVDMGAGGGTRTCELENGSVFTCTVSASAVTFVFNNPAATGSTSLTLLLTNGGSQTVTWPANTKWEGGVAPTLIASGKDLLSFITFDAGTTWYGVLIASDIK